MADAAIPIGTHAFNYGTGCLEGIRGYWDDDREEIYLVKIREHFRRLMASARALRITLPMDLDGLCQTAIELIRRNEYREDVYVRAIAYKASTAMRITLNELDDAFCCFPAPLGASPPRTQELAVRLVPLTRTTNDAVQRRPKATGSLLDIAAAVAEAEDARCDEVLFLGDDGYVFEGSVANVFLIQTTSGPTRLVTPDLSHGVFPGITRQAILELAPAMGLRVAERRLAPAELFAADELFFCATTLEVAAVTRVDDHRIGNGSAGEVTRAIRKRYLKAVHNKDKAFRHWLSPVFWAG